MSTAFVLAALSLVTFTAGDRLDMSAADDTQNAPYLVDSRFVVNATRRCALELAEARRLLEEPARAPLWRGASDAVATCRRLGAELAAVERQKGWTLPPPATPRYGPLIDVDLLTNARALAALFEQEAAAGRDGTVTALVRRELPDLRREQAALERTAPTAADGSP